jgi:hypothetical protein
MFNGARGSEFRVDFDELEIFREGGRDGSKAASCLRDIVEEFNRAISKHRKPLNSRHEGAAVLLEETDEFWDAVKADDVEHAKREAVQVAAVALRYLVEL